MAIEVIMPRLTHDMRTGVFVGWLVEPEHFVKQGQPLFEVETDKAVAEVAAEADGVLQGVCVQEGEQVPIGETIAYIVGIDEDFPESSIKLERTALPLNDASLVDNTPPVIPVSAAERPRIIASPIARRIAEEKGIDLKLLDGSGPRGRIIEADVRAYLDQRRTHPSTKERESLQEEAQFRRIPLTKIELATGRRMIESVQTIPQFTLEIDVEMSEAIRWREHYNQDAERKISFTGLLVRTTVAALKREPRLNSQIDGETLLQYQQVNLGVAIATPQGLIVPVLRAAEALNLPQIQMELETLRRQALVGKLPAERLSGATFTLSNLGMYGVDRFQAIINPPESAILSAGRIREQPWVENGEVLVRPVLTLRLTIDHRIADGAAAAPFLVELDRLLRNPYLHL